VERIANGGQILISGEVWNEVQHSLEELGNPVVTEMGAYRLAGLETDTEIHQILPHELEERKFPPLLGESELKDKVQTTISDQLQQISQENQFLGQSLTGMKSLLEESKEKARLLVDWMKMNNVPETEMSQVLNEMSLLIEEKEKMKRMSNLKPPSEKPKWIRPVVRNDSKKKQPPAATLEDEVRKRLSRMELGTLHVRKLTGNSFLVGERKVTVEKAGDGQLNVHTSNGGYVEFCEWAARFVRKKPATTVIEFSPLPVLQNRVKARSKSLQSRPNKFSNSAVIPSI